MEQEEYTKEKIDWSYIQFVDNQDVLDLIEKVTFLSQLSSSLLFKTRISVLNVTNFKTMLSSIKGMERLDVRCMSVMSHLIGVRGTQMRSPSFNTLSQRFWV